MGLLTWSCSTIGSLELDPWTMSHSNALHCRINVFVYVIVLFMCFSHEKSSELRIFMNSPKFYV